MTPADRAKLREVNVDSNGPMDELPLQEIAEAIDDPFDDEQPQVSCDAPCFASGISCLLLRWSRG